MACAARPMPEGEYWGGSWPTGEGVDEDVWVNVYLVSTPIESQDFDVPSERNRLDLIAPEGENPTGKLVFRNTGTGSFTGVASADVQFLPAELERGAARRYAYATQPAQRVQDLLGDAVAEVLLIARLTQIDERQHRDRHRRQHRHRGVRTRGRRHVRESSDDLGR